MQPKTLLLTRPLETSKSFAKQVESELGHIETVISPLLKIVLLDLPRPLAADTIVFTSRNGVAAWQRAGFDTTAECFCVGQATADAARELGFDPFASGGTVEHLLDDLCDAAPKGKILHVHGRHKAGDLVGELVKRGMDAEGQIAYEQKLLELNARAMEALKRGAPVIVPLFSPRSAAQFAKAGPFGAHVDIIAISENAAAVCAGARVAASPDARGMIAAISQGL